MPRAEGDWLLISLAGGPNHDGSNENEFAEPAFRLRVAGTLPAECDRARDLKERELDEVTGGAANLISGGIGAGLGGLVGGAKYAVSTSGANDFSWGAFAQETVRTAVSGFLIGTGSSLIVGAATGAVRGGAVLGGSMVGAGGALEAASGAPARDAGSERQ